MKTILAVLFASSMLTHACAQSNSITGGPSGTVMMSSGICSNPPAKCVVNFIRGNVSTVGCDFEKPLSNPTITPKGDSSLRMEFEQAPNTATVCLGSGSGLVPSR